MYVVLSQPNGQDPFLNHKWYKNLSLEFPLRPRFCAYIWYFEDGKNGGRPKKSVAARIASLKCDCFFLKPKLCCLYIVLWAKKDAIAAKLYRLLGLAFRFNWNGFVHRKYNSLLIFCMIWKWTLIIRPEL